MSTVDRALQSRVSASCAWRRVLALLLVGVLTASCGTYSIYAFTAATIPAPSGLELRVQLRPSVGTRDSARVVRNPYSLVFRGSGARADLTAWSIQSVELVEIDGTARIAGAPRAPEITPDDSSVATTGLHDLQLSFQPYIARGVVRHPDGSLHAFAVTLRPAFRKERRNLLREVLMG